MPPAKPAAFFTYQKRGSYNTHSFDSVFPAATALPHQSYQIKISLKCTDICWNLVYQYILVYVIIPLDKLEFDEVIF